jgi:hypothetical protein
MVLTSSLIPEIERSAVVGPATDVTHPLGFTPPAVRAQRVGDTRDVTMLSNAVELMAKSIEMTVER